MQNIQSTISDTIKTLYGVDFSPTLSVGPKPELGEYCINVFPLAKTLAQSPLSGGEGSGVRGKSPNIIAEEISTELAKHTEIFSATSATGGYVNFFLTDTLWVSLFQHTKNQKPKPKHHKTIVVDYIGMNVGKPPHIGHICTPLQGQSIINTARYLGYDVIGDSHIGDWGSLFGKLIVGYRKYGNAEKLKSDAIDHLLDIYIKINADAEADPTVEQECRDAFRELSDGNPEYTALWAEFTTMTISTMRRMLETMHVYEDYDIGESFYEGIDLPRIGDEPPLQYDMDSIVDELIDQGIAMKNDDGSVGVIFPEETKMPSTILRKKDGTNLYLTSDLAAIKYRLTNGWNPSKIIYCVDIRQQLHLKQAFWIAQAAWPEITKNTEFFHAANGALVLPEGAMSTRKWNIIRLDALVDEGFVRTKRILEEKGNTLSDADTREITVGAIKYSYLTQDRERNITFDWDKALNFEWHSGPYIQYAYVRGKKILTWVQIDTIKNPKDLELSSYDKLLIQVLDRFDDVVSLSAKTYKPHHIAIYAYELAVAFNSFYVHTPKILEETNPDLKNFRLELIGQTTETLKTAFSLLAIEMPSEM